MPWRVSVATYNTVHGEDDVAFWLSSDSSWGSVAVADGVSATSGGGASYLAVNSFIHACRIYGPDYDGVPTLRRCLDYVSSVAREARPEHADLVEELKKVYYRECSRGGDPCTRPLTLTLLLEEKPRLPPSINPRREAPPSTTLLAAAMYGDRIGFIISGDGAVIGSTGRRSEEVYLLWGAIPQYFAGTKVARFLEIGAGVRGRPLVFDMAAVPGSVYAIATDGVDMAALAEELAALIKTGEMPEEPAAYILRRLREKTGGFEDDATLAIIEYTG